jgi:26S proteasome regulatory subunit N12
MKVSASAAHPPVKYYSFFLTSLLETVRINIGECIASAYQTLRIDAAIKVLMFETRDEAIEFIATYFPSWLILGDRISIEGVSKAARSEEIASMELISQNLLYAIELERIV